MKLRTLAWMIIGALLLFLTLTSAANAELIVNKYTNDFSLTSPYSSTVKACACEPRADVYTITNTGNFPTTYHATVISDDDWYQLSTTTFTLNPGENRKLILYATPHCDTTGTYQYSLKVTSTYGRERIITRTLDVKKCQNLFLTIGGGKNESNIGEPLTYTLALKNVAEFADFFTLDFGSFNEYATINKTTYYLTPNQEVRVNVTITPPLSLYGDVEIPVTIMSEKNKVSEKRTVHVYIENQYDHEIKVKTQEEVCSRVPSTYTFTVKNLIDVPNDYDISITGAGFLSYTPKRLHLNGYEAKNVTVTLTPKNGEEGKYHLKIRVNSKLGKIKKSRTVELDVFDCFAYSVGAVSLPEEDGAYTDTACCGAKTYTLNVRNEGETEETYNILTDGPAWFTPEEQTIRLKPSENRNVKITAALPCTDETYEIPVTVVMTKHPEIKEEALFRLTSETQRTCHAVNLKEKEVAIDEETNVVPFIIRNDGLKGGVYDVNVTSELYNHVMEKSVALEPGEQAVIHLVPVENLTDYFAGKYVSTLTLTLQNTTISYYKPFWTRLHHVSPLTKAWRAIIHYNYGALGPCFWSIIFLALLLIASLAALIPLRGKVAPLTRGPLNVGRGILIVAILVVAALLFTTPLPSKASLYEPAQNTTAAIKTTGANTTGIVFQWYENEQYSVDLSTYFRDPDKDWLEYTATQPAHVAVVIKGKTATLIPEKNWAGTDQLYFTASDQKGGVADSPAITLQVLRRKKLSVPQWLNRYCRHVTLSLLLALFAVMLVMSILVTPRKRVPYGVVLEPRKKAVQTKVLKDGTVQKLDTTTPAIEKQSPRGRPRQPAERKSVRLVQSNSLRQTEKQTARSSTMDANLVACNQEHEMRTVLKAHGLRSTKENIKRMQEACRRFKMDKTRTHNRAEFYRWLTETGTLATFEKAKPLDNKYELQRLLSKLGKRTTQRNINILREALSDFQQRTPNKENFDKEKFARYLKEQGVMRRLHNKKRK